MAEFIGSLRERVTVEHWQAAADDTGAAAGAWTAQASVWAAIVPVDTSATPVVGEQRTQRPRFRLTLRQRGGIDLVTRIRWQGRALTVLRIERDPRTPERLTILVEDRT